MKIFVLVNTLQSVSSFVYSNHIHFFVKSLKDWYAKKGNLDLDMIFYTPHRMSIDMARNTAAKAALESECDYLMFIDDDVLVPADTLTKMIDADKDIIAGLVIIRGYPFNVMAFEFKEQSEEEKDKHAERQLEFFNAIPLKEPCESGHMKYSLECPDCVKSGQLVELAKCDAVGFSCCLIKCDVLKALEPPYFVTARNHTEDIYFCLKIRTLDPIPEIYLHTGVRCGHLLNPEPIEFTNRAVLKPIYTPIVEKELARDKEYIDKCLQALEAQNVTKN